MEKRDLEALAARALRYCDTLDPDACWRPADGRYQDKDGYLRLGLWDGQKQRMLRVSRVQVALATGADVDDRSWKALHACDNPPCINPKHLRVGTDSDNQQDMIQRGRRYADPECGNGHAWTLENTYMHGRHRLCRACRARAARDFRRRAA